jgi:NADH-quinone oxidoreductase subunit L
MQETVLPGANAPYSTFLYVLIPLLPFLGFLINGLLNKKLSGTVAGLIGSATVLGSFLISVMLFMNFQYQYTVQLSTGLRSARCKSPSSTRLTSSA